MRSNLRNVFYVFVAAVSVTACGTVQKAIKTGDPELIYNTGVELYEDEQWSRATTLFNTVSHLYVGSSREDSLSYFMARCRAKAGDYYTAIDQLEQFRREFGRSVFIEDAESMYAMCYYYLSPGPTRDQTTTNQAIAAAHEFMARYPESQKNEGFEQIVAELQERLYEKSYLNAYTYYKIGRYKSAIVAFRNALKEYPESTRREDNSYYVVASSYELAKNSIPSKQLDRYISMLDSYYTFIAEFPESSHSKSVDKMAREAKKFIAENHVVEDEEEDNPEIPKYQL
ncbi:MAG: outer membrane protein assembly factor BamD [Rikenellaceae bacterium]